MSQTLYTGIYPPSPPPSPGESFPLHNLSFASLDSSTSSLPPVPERVPFSSRLKKIHLALSVLPHVICPPSPNSSSTGREEIRTRLEGEMRAIMDEKKAGRGRGYLGDYASQVQSSKWTFGYRGDSANDFWDGVEEEVPLVDTPEEWEEWVRGAKRRREVRKGKERVREDVPEKRVKLGMGDATIQTWRSGVIPAESESQDSIRVKKNVNVIPAEANSNSNSQESLLGFKVIKSKVVTTKPKPSERQGPTKPQPPKAKNTTKPTTRPPPVIVNPSAKVRRSILVISDDEDEDSEYTPIRDPLDDIFVPSSQPPILPEDPFSPPIHEHEDREESLKRQPEPESVDDLYIPSSLPPAEGLEMASYAEESLQMMSNFAYREHGPNRKQGHGYEGDLGSAFELKLKDSMPIPTNSDPSNDLSFRNVVTSTQHPHPPLSEVFDLEGASGGRDAKGDEEPPSPSFRNVKHSTQQQHPRERRGTNGDSSSQPVRTISESSSSKHPNSDPSFGNVVTSTQRPHPHPPPVLRMSEVFEEPPSPSFRNVKHSTQHRGTNGDEDEDEKHPPSFRNLKHSTHYPPSPAAETRTNVEVDIFEQDQDPEPSFAGVQQSTQHPRFPSHSPPVKHSAQNTSSTQSPPLDEHDHDPFEAVVPSTQAPLVSSPETPKARSPPPPPDDEDPFLPQDEPSFEVVVTSTQAPRSASESLRNGNGNAHSDSDDLSYLSLSPHSPNDDPSFDAVVTSTQAPHFHVGKGSVTGSPKRAGLVSSQYHSQTSSQSQGKREEVSRSPSHSQSPKRKKEEAQSQSPAQEPGTPKRKRAEELSQSEVASPKRKRDTITPPTTPTPLNGDSQSQHNPTPSKFHLTPKPTARSPPPSTPIATRLYPSLSGFAKDKTPVRTPERERIKFVSLAQPSFSTPPKRAASSYFKQAASPNDTPLLPDSPYSSPFKTQENSPDSPPSLRKPRISQLNRNGNGDAQSSGIWGMDYNSQFMIEDNVEAVSAFLDADVWDLEG